MLENIIKTNDEDSTDTKMEQNKINYKHLLKTYMSHIIEEEGFAYLNNTWRNNIEYTDIEKKELLKIAHEIGYNGWDCENEE